MAHSTASAAADQAQINSPAAESASSTLAHRKLISMSAAALLGIGILFMVGFAPGMAHQAAHDVRHSATFPCH